MKTYPLYSINLDEAKNILKENGYILDEFFPFKGKKKEEKEEIDPVFYTLPGGQRKKDGSYHYPGLTMAIRASIDLDHNGSITKEQALTYMTKLLPMIKENPGMNFDLIIKKIIMSIN